MVLHRLLLHLLRAVACLLQYVERLLKPGERCTFILAGGLGSSKYVKARMQEAFGESVRAPCW
jgi:hypothetical protein